jgi:hypothetical protein
VAKAVPTLPPATMLIPTTAAVDAAPNAAHRDRLPDRPAVLCGLGTEWVMFDDIE